MTFSAGQVLTASALNAALTRIIAYGERTSNSSTSSSTTPVSVVRLDSIPITDGYTYVIHSSPLIFQSTVAGDLLEAGVYVSTAGAATSASTHATGLVDDAKSAAASQKTKGFEVPYVSTTTGSLSVLLTVARSTGTGACAIYASATYPLKLWVTNEGPSQSDTAVLL